MKKYAHIGYAKSGSTWLQTHFFPRHPELHHLGRARGDWIINDRIRLLLWRDYIENLSFMFAPENGRREIEEQIIRAGELGKRATGISHELLTNPVHGRIDLAQRAERLKETMGAETHIVMIVREPLSWILSLYKGLVKEGGLYESLDEFLFYFYFDYDRSPFSALFYDRVFDLYASLFGEENVSVLPFELLKESPQRYVDRLCDSMEISRITAVDSRPKNEALSDQEIEAVCLYNRVNRYNLGAGALERPWGFTALPIYAEAGVEPPARIETSRKHYLTVFNHSRSILAQATKQGLPLEGKEIRIPEKYRRLFQAAYAPHMKRLQQRSGVDIERYGYPV